MHLKYSPNKLSKDNNEINLASKITTLIWENWSGKSTILETIMKNQLDRNYWLVISYSSWMNESFTNILKPYINKNKHLTIKWTLEENILCWFYFDKRWASFLIFLSYSLKNNWRVKEFLMNDKNKYLLKDNEPILHFNVKIDDTYISTLKKSLWQHKSLMTSDFHIMLDKLLNSTHNWWKLTVFDNWKWYWGVKDKNNYDFDRQRSFNALILESKYCKDIFWIDKNKILYFLAMLTNKSYFISLKDVILYFNNWISLNDLSDWEFQLLVVYALLDLFDSKNTIFLFDEVDSHLHYKNINTLWEILKSTEWNIITTTHIPDSIINNKIEEIMLVKWWIIDNDNTANSILNRLDNISNKNIFEKIVASNIEYIVLIDDCTDWFIFLEFAKIKLWHSYNHTIEKIHPIKCYSWYKWSPNEIFWQKKLEWIKDFISKNNIFNTKKIFSICDKDEEIVSKIDDNMKYKEYHSWNNIKTQQFGNGWNIYYLSWKRREIENYFLSYTLLNKYWYLDELNAELWKSNILQENKSWDNNKVRDFQAKEIVQKFTQKELNWNFVWKDYNDLKEIIKLIPPEEISEDIEKMYDFIIHKI